MAKYNQLLSDDFIKIAYDTYGEDIKAWPESLKDRAAQMAQRNGTKEQLNDIFQDFFPDRHLLRLYNYQVKEVLDEAYARLESPMQDDIDAWVEANVTERVRGCR